MLTEYAGNSYVTEAGAQEIANRIRRYWAVRGKRIDIWVEPMAATKSQTIFVVRSDMVNGSPRQ